MPCLFYCSYAATKCSRENVDYYLEKGFSREQVTAICGSSQFLTGLHQSDHRPTYFTDERAPDNNRKVGRNLLFLRDAIVAEDIELTPQRLEYTRSLCIVAGTSPDTGNERSCPKVRSHIYFANLDVAGSKRRYFFFGQHEIEVSGKVRHQLLGGSDKYSPRLRKELLRRYYDTLRNGSTRIILRKDAAAERVIALLKNYARRATGAVG